MYYDAKRHNELLGIMKVEREEYFKNCEIEKEELAIERAKINRGMFRSWYFVFPIFVFKIY